MEMEADRLGAFFRRSLMTRTLDSLKEALQQPFAPDTIQFLPKEIHKENGTFVCFALPYANKRVYEDRLNALVFGEWSTPYTAPYARENKLILPVTVVILGIEHTDYGEAFFTTTGRNGSPREDENTATEAYSQAFRRACSKFFLGRYLYDLPKLHLPYDPKTRQIAISKAERIAWVEKLYQARGLLPKRSTATSLATDTPSEEAPTARVASASAQTVHAALALAAKPTPPASLQATVTTHKPVQVYPTSYADTFLDWVCRTVNRDPQRIQGICTYYQVAQLTHLSVIQQQQLTRQLQKQAAAPAPSASSVSHQTKR
jgi:hypothetical protein